MTMCGCGLCLELLIVSHLSIFWEQNYGQLEKPRVLRIKNACFHLPSLRLALIQIHHKILQLHKKSNINLRTTKNIKTQCKIMQIHQKPHKISKSLKSLQLSVVSYKLQDFLLYLMSKYSSKSCRYSNNPTEISKLPKTNIKHI